MTRHVGSRLDSRCRCRRPPLDDDRPAEMSSAGDAASASAALGGTKTRGRIVRCERRRWGRGARAFVVRSFTLSFATRRVVRDANASTRTRVDGRARESDVRANRTRERRRGDIVEIAREATVSVEAARERRD